MASTSVQLIDALLNSFDINNSPVCTNCDASLSTAEQKECCECSKSICSNCGVMDASIIESQAPYICRDCIPVECNECKRVLIDEDLWEENVAYCDGCDKLFCDYNLSPNCILERIDGVFECRNCVKKTKILSNVDTMQKYRKYVEDNHIEQDDEETFKTWVQTQNDPSIKYEVVKPPQPPDAPLITKHSKEEVRKQFMESASCMKREMILDIQATARDEHGRTSPPLVCESCGSSEKDRYFMLRTHFIAYECIDCAVENAIAT
eukprot:609968_1